MIDRAVRDTWSLVMFFKFSNCTRLRLVQFWNLKNITRAHISRNALSFIRFPILIIIIIILMVIIINIIIIIIFIIIILLYEQEPPWHF